MSLEKIALPQVLQDSIGQNGSADEIDIILVAGPGSLPIEQWGIVSPSFLKELSKLDHIFRLLTFKYDNPINDRFTWRDLLAAGDLLLDSLLVSYGKDESPRPIIFICHSLGGTFLKQALSKLTKANQDHQYSQSTHVLNLVSGLMFLGTPHNQLNQDAFKESIMLLLKLCTNSTLNKQQLADLSTEFWILGDIANRFQYSNISVDILSVYESQSTKIEKTKLFARSSKRIVVDKALCTISSPYEQIVSLNKDHLHLCEMLDDSFKDHNPILHWLRSVAGNSRQNVTERIAASHAYNDPSPTASSFSSFTVMRTALGKTNISIRKGITEGFSGNATEGSTSFDAEMIPILDNLVPQRRVAKLPCFMVETFQPNDNFIGRQGELKLLDLALLPSRPFISTKQQQKYAAICGMGGLGKTEIALQFAFSRGRQYDAVFWLRADNREKLDTDLAKIAVYLGLAEQTDGTETQLVLRETAKGWLANPKKYLNPEIDSIGTADANWLLVLDNADDLDILTDYTHFFGSGSVLVTSRHPLAKQSYRGASIAIDLQPFEENHAVDLLRKITGEARHSDQALKIVQKLGGLPLAISQMAGIIRRHMLTDTEFLNMYQDQADRVALYSLEMQPRRQAARGSVATTWAIEKLSSPAKAVLALLAFMDPDKIPDCMTDQVSKISLDSSDSFPNLPNTKIDFNFARAELLERSLIRRNEKQGDLWIHRVLQDTVRGKLEDDEKFRAFACTVELLDSVWPKASLDRRHNIDRWTLCQSIYPHILFLRNIYLEYSIQANAKVNIKFATLLNEAGWWQLEKGNSHSSHINRELLRHAYQIGERHQGRDVEDLLCDIHYSLGAVANETNDADSCIKHNSAFLEMRLRIAKEQRRKDLRLGIAYNQIGTGWMMVKDYQRAAGCFQDAIDTYKSLPEFNKYMLSIPIANLGLANWLQGYFNEAFQGLLQGLRDREEMWGFNDHESFRTGRLLHALGNVCFDQDRLEESESFHQRALASYQAAIGNNHHRTADVCHKVAQHCLRHGKYEEALILVDQALRAWGADLEAYLQEIARTSFLKAKILFGLGDEENANRLFKQAAATITKLSRAPDAIDHKELNEHVFDEIVTFWSR